MCEPQSKETTLRHRNDGKGHGRGVAGQERPVCNRDTAGNCCEVEDRRNAAAFRSSEKLVEHLN